MNAEPVGKGQDFGIKGILISVCSQSSIDHTGLSGLWLHAGKESIWRAKEAERIGGKAISEQFTFSSI